MNITNAMIKRICSSMIYKRGVEFFNEGRVHLRRRAENELTAVVDGEELYNVRILFENGEISDMFCGCPYYEMMNTPCKHIVATLKQRRAELKAGEIPANDNDKIASLLCSEFIECQAQERIRVSFMLFVNSGTDGDAVFEMSVSLPEYDVSIQHMADFFDAYLNYTDFRIGKKTIYNRRSMSFSENEEKIISVLAEVHQTHSLGADAQSGAAAVFGSAVVRRILPYLDKVDFKLVYDGMVLGGVRILEEDPDIPIDVRTYDREISLSVSELGFAMTPDGEWFLHNDTIYKTSEMWRRYFMPIHRTLVSENRMQVIFRGDNAMLFAKNVLPRLNNKHGVVISGVNEIVVSSEPEFEIWLDASRDGITAVAVAIYGDIKFTIPTDAGNTNGKIIIRNFDKENRILSFFEGFERSRSAFVLRDERSIYEFVTQSVNILSVMARTVMTDRFKAMFADDDLNMLLSVAYDDIDYFEMSFETSLTAQEIDSIIAAMRSDAEFYRLSDGRFLDLKEGKNAQKLKLIEELELTGDDIAVGRRKLPKSYLLYLSARDDVEKDESVNKYLDKIRRTEGAVPRCLDGIIRPYQRDGITWLTQLSQMDMGGILADDMGLGKTLQVIAFIHGIKSDRPALVVVPSALLYSWQSEIEKFIPDAKTLIIVGTRDERAELIKSLDDYEFVITSYPLLRRDGALYRDIMFSYCFIDEAQYIKNPKTKNAISVKRINAEHKFALTGTPIENSLTELWSMFDFVMHGYLGGKSEFHNRYELPAVNGGTGSDALRSRIRPFVMRRMKKDVLSELPPKIETVMKAELGREQKALYIKYLNDAKSSAQSIVDSGGNKMLILTLLLRLRQICCHPALFLGTDASIGKRGESGKLDLLNELIRNGTDSGHRILVFSQFRSMLDIIAKSLDAADTEYFYINGSTPSAERMAMAERFNGGERGVFLVSLKAGGTGLNLIGADMVIHYDPWWNPAVTDQASDRAYRIGQTRSVQVIRLVSKGSIEEKILKLQQRKRLLADDIIQENHDTLRSLTNDEIMSLFEV